MKTFRWDLVSRPDLDVEYYWLSETENDIGKIWGFISQEGDVYRSFVYNKNRTDRQTIYELLPLKDAKEAIEKKLFDDDIIQDGDTLEDYTIP